MGEELASTVYLGGIPDDVTPEMIKNVFITFGEIKSVEIPLDHESCECFYLPQFFFREEQGLRIH